MIVLAASCAPGESIGDSLSISGAQPNARGRTTRPVHQPPSSHSPRHLLQRLLRRLLHLRQRIQPQATLIVLLRLIELPQSSRRLSQRQVRLRIIPGDRQRIASPVIRSLEVPVILIEGRHLQILGLALIRSLSRTLRQPSSFRPSLLRRLGRRIVIAPQRSRVSAFRARTAATGTPRAPGILQPIPLRRCTRRTLRRTPTRRVPRIRKALRRTLRSTRRRSRSIRHRRRSLPRKRKALRRTSPRSRSTPRRSTILPIRRRLAIRPRHSLPLLVRKRATTLRASHPRRQDQTRPSAQPNHPHHKSRSQPHTSIRRHAALQR